MNHQKKSEGGSRKWILNAGYRLSKESVSSSRYRCQGKDDRAAPASAPPAVTVYGASADLSDGNGGQRWSTLREIAKLGHEVRLMSPRFVRCEVEQERRERCRGQLRGRCPTLDAIRNGEELAAAGYARVAPSTFADKSGGHGVDESDARVECGVVVTLGPTRLHRALAEILGDRGARVSELLREAFAEMGERLRSFEGRLERYDRQIRGSRERTLVSSRSPRM
jgi:hypothetical protein